MPVDPQNLVSSPVPVNLTNEKEHRRRLAEAINRHFRTNDSSGTPNNPHSQYMLWRNQWESGVRYVAHETVVDSGWAMVANKQTTDRPAPQEVGLPSYDLGDTPAFVEQSFLGTVAGGHNYSFTSGGWATGIQVYAAETGPTISYRVGLFNFTDPLQPTVKIIEDPVVVANAWSTISVDQSPIVNGSNISVILEAINSAANTLWTHSWTFAGNENVAAPATTEWNKRQQQDIVRLHDNDLVGDQSVDLAAVTAGSTLKFENVADSTEFWRYSVISSTDQGTYFEYGVVLLETGAGGGVPAGATTTVNAVIPTPQNTAYEELVGNWPAGNPSWATVEGRLELGGVPQSVVGNAYGVRILFQPASLSADWDFLAFSDLTNAGSSRRTATREDPRITERTGDPVSNSSDIPAITGRSFVDQTPTGLGIGNQIQVSFGPAQLPELDALGTFTAPFTRQFSFVVSINAERTTSGGISELWFYATKNGVQLTSASTLIFLDRKDDRIEHTVSVFEQLEEDDEVKFFLYRDSGSMDDGFLATHPNTDGLADAASAFLEVTELNVA